MEVIEKSSVDEQSPAPVGDGVDENRNGMETVIQRFRRTAQSAADPAEAVLTLVKADLIEVTGRLKGLWDGIELLRPESWEEDSQMRARVLQMYLPALRQIERLEQLSLRQAEMKFRAARSMDVAPKQANANDQCPAA